MDFSWDMTWEGSAVGNFVKCNKISAVSSVSVLFSFISGLYHGIGSRSCKVKRGEPRTSEKAGNLAIAACKHAYPMKHGHRHGYWT